MTGHRSFAPAAPAGTGTGTGTGTGAGPAHKPGRRGVRAAAIVVIILALLAR